MIIGDATRIRQLLWNLISNAVKFTHHGSVLVSGALRPYNGVDRIQLTVSDSGIGMQPEAIEKLFEPFEQGHENDENHYVGTGLGMSIVKRIIDALHGTIDVESTKGSGTTITLMWPVKVTSTNSSKHPVMPAAQPQSAAKQSEFKVLLAEDNRINQRVAEATIKKIGGVVHLAENGQRQFSNFISNPSI